MSILSHRIALIVTKEQDQALHRACGVARYTYNWALAQSKAYYEETGHSINFNELRREWTQCKPSWVYESPKDANFHPFDELRTAYINFFREILKGNTNFGPPKFKKKGKCRDSFYLANDRFWTRNLIAKLPVIGKVKLTEELKLEGKILHETVTREADRWFLSVTIEGDFDKERIANNIVGVDLGIKSLAILSTGETIEGPTPLRKSQKKLARLQKEHSRKQRGSKNKAKLTIKLARMHSKIKNIRKDALHKLTTKLCSENQTIVIEDLKVSEMLKNHQLAKAISDMGFGIFKEQLEYKSKLYHNTLVIADRWFPSSKTCSCCGHLKETLKLSEREYICEHCGFSLDRDFNAALNLKALGLRVLACGQPSTDTLTISE